MTVTARILYVTPASQLNTGLNDYDRPGTVHMRIDVIPPKFMHGAVQVNDLLARLAEAKALLPEDVREAARLKFGGTIGYEKWDTSEDHYMHIDYDRAETPDEIAERKAKLARDVEIAKQGDERRVVEAKALLRARGITTL